MDERGKRLFCFEDLKGLSIGPLDGVAISVLQVGLEVID